MNAENELIDNPLRHQVNITRVFDAPRQLVFSMWTNPEYLAMWWGPAGFTNPVCDIEVKNGGALNIVMQAPDGTRIPVSGVFQEIVEPELIVFTTYKLDANGHSELEVLNRVTLREENGKTILTMIAIVVKSTPEAIASVQGMQTGWAQSLDRFAETLLVI